MMHGVVLLGDLNGQELLLALARPGEPPGDHGVFACATALELESVFKQRLEGLDGEELIGAAISAAGPLLDGAIRVTRTDLSLSGAWLRHVLRTPRVFLLNDLAAVALGAPKVPEEQLTTLHPARADRGGAMAVIGLGLGLGVAGLTPQRGDNWTAIPSEAGHVDFCPAEPREVPVFEAIRARRGDTAAERLLSRAGLSDIYAAVHGGPGAIGPENAAEAIERARGGELAALKAMSIFSGLLGAFAGDMALTFAARGGVYLDSSLIQDMGDLLDLEAFQRRFRAKGLMSDYMLGIPVMQMPGRPVLLGLSSLFSASDRVYGATDVKFLDC
ncbi:glucokinase [Caulobacter sp. DWR1-3-2b1]|uniref:glucokinase n=1 Tax=Caulobacter sp. DWR1-3-2b1 TaxID=2804670 RepID=UPI003CEA1560